MNKTLLLVICDFLLLNLLALTRWEKAEPPHPSRAPIPQVANGARSAEQDLVETMRQSLADEQSARNAMAARLTDREKTLASLESEKARLNSSLDATQQRASELSRKLDVTEQTAEARQAQLQSAQRDLALREAEAARQREQLAALEKAQAEAREKIDSLNVAVKVADQEKRMLRETADTLRQQVEAERKERERIQATTVQLAQGVGELAEKSGELTKEIRDNRPINANVLFNGFLANRVAVAVRAEHDNGFLGTARRAGKAQSVLVSDGKNTYALFHVDETPFGFNEIPADWSKIAVDITRGGHTVSPAELDFLSADPRIVAIPLDASQVASLGSQVYPLAADPFKFPEAMLVNRDGVGYGEVPFHLDPANPGFVRMDNRLFKKLLGDFTPSRGDLVFSRSGAFLGIMVSSDYCAVLGALLPARSLKLPDTSAQNTSKLLSEMAARVQSLPFRMQ